MYIYIYVYDCIYVCMNYIYIRCIDPSSVAASPGAM